MLIESEHAHQSHKYNDVLKKKIEPLYTLKSQYRRCFVIITARVHNINSKQA